MEEFKHIIDRIEGMPKVLPPADFTDKVMDRIACAHREKNYLKRSLRGTAGRVSARVEFTKSECSLFFFMAGVFHLILASILFMGFEKIFCMYPDALWIISQPAISLLTAFGFISLGVLLYKKNVNAVKTAQIGIAAYIAFVIINGLAIHRHFDIPLIMVMFLSFTVGGILVGIILGILVHRCEKPSAHDGYMETF